MATLKHSLMADELDLSDFHELSLIRDLELSPDGERVAFVVTESDPEADVRRNTLFVVPADGRDDPYRLTRASGAGTPKWSPDGTKLGFIATREQDTALRVGPKDETRNEDKEAEETDADSDETENTSNSDEPKAQVWVFDLARGGDARQVTERGEGVRAFDWGPDGERIVISARDPTEKEQEELEQRREDGPIEIERLQHKANGQGWLDSVTSYLFVVDLDSREEHRLDEAYGGGAAETLMDGLQPAWGASDRIAFLSNRTEHPDDSGVYDVFTIDPDGGDLRKLTDSELRAEEPQWCPNGDRLAFIGSHPTNLYRPSQVYVAEPDEGTYSSVTPELDRTTAWGASPEWIGDVLLTAIGDEGRSQLVRCHADGDSPERVFEEQEEYRTIYGLSATENGVAVGLTASDATPNVFTMSADLDDLDPTRVTDLNPSFERKALSLCERIHFENRDGEPIEAFAFLPDAFDVSDPEPHPLIVNIHGGPMSYDTAGFSFDRAYWTSQGYVVLCVNYRGSTSYERTFSEQLRGTRGELESDDINCGVDRLLEREWADPDRLFVTGFSYGGIATAHVVARTDRFTGAAPEHGIYDWYSLFGTDDCHLWTGDEFGLPWKNGERYREISSLSRVGEIDTPLLITAGDEDWRCPPTQAEQLYVSVKKRGVPAKLVVYQNEHHNIGNPERAIHRLRTIEQWFEGHDPTIDAEA